MKKFIAKISSVSLLCILLTILMLFSGCNNGSSATNIFESVKEASEVQKCDFKMNMEFEASDQTASIIFEGTVNSPESMMASATVKSGAMTLKIGDIIVDGDKMYLKINDFLTLIGSVDILEGKEYILFDTDELESFAEMTGEEVPSADNEKAMEDLSKLVTDKLYEVLEKSTEGVEPAVLGKDGNKFTFTVNKDNMIEYIRSVVNVVADEQDWILNTLPEALEDAGLSEVADMITDNESAIADALDNAVETVKEDPKNQLGEDDEFEINAYSEMLNEGGRSWNMGVEIDVTTSGEKDLISLNGNSATLKLEVTITENAGDKPITEVDEDDAISYIEIMKKTMSSMQDSDDLMNSIYTSAM